MYYQLISIADINTNAITFTQPESFLRRNYLTNDTSPEKTILSKIFTEQILVNLRTYETNALIFYANDNLNNFVHLYIENATQVVFLFNYGNVIHNLTVHYSELNSSKSIQIAIVRSNLSTIMHINDKNCSIPIGVKLLQEYSNKPWSNPEKGKSFCNYERNPFKKNVINEFTANLRIY